jgi:hypothetical protein
MSSRGARADNPDIVSSIHVHHYQNTIPKRQTNRHKALLFGGMQRVIDRQRQRMTKNGGRFLKRNTVLPNVLASPILILLK